MYHEPGPWRPILVVIRSFCHPATHTHTNSRDRTHTHAHTCLAHLASRPPNDRSGSTVSKHDHHHHRRRNKWSSHDVLRARGCEVLTKHLQEPIKDITVLLRGAVVVRRARGAYRIVSTVYIRVQTVWLQF